jgi:hypothetical protein
MTPSHVGGGALPPHTHPYTRNTHSAFLANWIVPSLPVTVELTLPLTLWSTLKRYERKQGSAWCHVSPSSAMQAAAERCIIALALHYFTYFASRSCMAA